MKIGYKQQIRLVLYIFLDGKLVWFNHNNEQLMANFVEKKLVKDNVGGIWHSFDVLDMLWIYYTSTGENPKTYVLNQMVSNHHHTHT